MANGWRVGLVMCTKSCCPWFSGRLHGLRSCRGDLGGDSAGWCLMRAGLTAGGKVTWQRLIDEE